MVEFEVEAETTAAADAVLAAARDFSERRIEIWPNVSARRYEVHAAGETFAEVTEAALQGFVWERTRYEWREPGSVRQTVIDSNVLAPGSTWQLAVTPNGRGCHVRAVFRREFRRTPRGLFGWLINRFAAGPAYGGDLRRALAKIERSSEGAS